MWKNILSQFNSSVAVNWRWLLALILGIGAGSVLCSCSVVAPAWDGVKDGTETVVTTGEDVVVSVYQGGKGLIGDGVGAVEGAIEGGYELVTSPFTNDEE